MIVTVKLGNLNYKTIAIELPDKYIDTDQDYLDIVNELVCEKVWSELSNYERVQYQNKIENMKPLPIIMMYSRNKYSYN